MTKIVYNACFGGFGLSEEELDRYIELSGKHPTYARDIERTDPFLIQVVEEKGSRPKYWAANLQIAELPPGTKYRIDEYDGFERVMTLDDYEWSIA